MALDDAVFLNDPEDMEAYETWLARFDLEHKNSEIAQFLTANPHLQLHYSQLVPDKVSHLVFWHRYYYGINLILDEEAKNLSIKLKEEENSTRQQSSTNKTSGNSSGNGSPVGDIGAGSSDCFFVLILIFKFTFPLN